MARPESFKLELASGDHTDEPFTRADQIGGSWLSSAARNASVDRAVGS